MALEIPEGTVVSEEVEPVDNALEGAARLVAPVSPFAHVGTDQREAIGLGHLGGDCLELKLREIAGRIQDRGHKIFFCIRIPVHERHTLGRFRDLIVQDASGEGRDTFPGVAEVCRPGTPSVGEIHTLHELGNYPIELPQHCLSYRSDFGQGRGLHPDEHVLECLPRGEDPEIGNGCRREHAPESVAGLGLDGGPPDAV